MRSKTFIILLVASSFLSVLTLRSNDVQAQNTMSPEDEAVYKNMIKASGLDPEVMIEAKKNVDSSRKWTDAKDGIIHYHIVGDYQKKTNIVGGSNWIGYADVSDRVVIDLDWKLSESQMVGTPSFQNSKSIVSNLSNPEPTCSPPIIKGDYEHFELQAIKEGMGGALEMQAKTSFPTVEVAQNCTGSRTTVPASNKSYPEEMVVPSPVMFSMQLPDSDNLSISADKKSLLHKDGGWTWTFTPSVSK